jgi:hypothetical protein
MMVMMGSLDSPNIEQSQHFARPRRSKNLKNNRKKKLKISDARKLLFVVRTFQAASTLDHKNEMKCTEWRRRKLLGRILKAETRLSWLCLICLDVHLREINSRKSPETAFFGTPRRRPKAGKNKTKLETVSEIKQSHRRRSRIAP